eukprot:Gb_10183 [translate_table: standard]
MGNPSGDDVMQLSQEESQHLPTVSKEPRDSKNKEHWDTQSTNILLNKYEDIYVKLDRGHLRLKDWKLLAIMVNEELGTHRATYQCKNKIEYMRKQFRRERLKLNSMGSALSSWPYFDRMAQILGSIPKHGNGAGVNVGEVSPVVAPNGHLLPHLQVQATDTTDENEAVSLPRAQLRSTPEVSGKPPTKKKRLESLNLAKELKEGLGLFASMIERIEKMKMEMTMTLERERMDREERRMQLMMRQEERRTEMLLQTQLQIATLFAQLKAQTDDQNQNRDQQKKDGESHPIPGCMDERPEHQVQQNMDCDIGRNHS